jgi:hypothetical protein
MVRPYSLEGLEDTTYLANYSFYIVQNAEIRTITVEEVTTQKLENIGLAVFVDAGKSRAVHVLVRKFGIPIVHIVKPKLIHGPSSNFSYTCESH